MNKKHSGMAICLIAFVVSTSLYMMKRSEPQKPSADEGFLSIVKNDRSSFEKYLLSGGSLLEKVSISQKDYTLGELLVEYERVPFIQFASSGHKSLNTTQSSISDIWYLAIPKNNPELLQSLISAHPGYRLPSRKYGKEERNLLHLASAQCSHKLVSILEAQGMKWNEKDKFGSTALTLAADHDCLQILKYWKEQGADFKAKDGQGRSALSLLMKRKDLAIQAFAQTFQDKRAPAAVLLASAPQVPNFYKKRQIPQESFNDRSRLIEPGERPDEANETADYSEFSD
jgi:hypothetical protein